jgi:hypothetical protein
MNISTCTKMDGVTGKKKKGQRQKAFTGAAHAGDE